MPAPDTAARPPAVPPVAERRPTTRDFGGIRIDDPYAWLEDPDDPATVAYLEAENAYREAATAELEPLREALYAEMLGRVEQSDRTVPVRIGGWFYATRTVEGQQHPILVRAREEAALETGGDPGEEVLLDLNAMVRTGYVRLDDWEPDPTGRLLAYRLNETGGIEGTLRVKDLETGETLADEMAPVADFVWANDGRTLFYVRQDEDLRPADLLRHRLGDEPAADPLLYREEDERFALGVDAAKDRSFLFATSWSAEFSEVRVLPADRPDDAWRVFAPRREGVLYHLEHAGDEFLMLTNEDARDFRLLAARVDDPAVRRELVPHQPGRLLTGMESFAGHLALFGREDGLTQVWVRDWATGALRRQPWDEAVYAVHPEPTPEFRSPAVRVAYSSFATPPTVYDLDLATGERTLRKRDRIPSGHNPADYATERLEATAPDGTRVPISLVRRAGGPAGPLPTLVYGYGAYGYSMDPAFNRNVLSLLDRGMAFAVAHVRGGQELGRGWYDDGKLLRKTNSFTDFLACAEHLVATDRADRERLVFAGGSAGGLLLGAVVNLRPDLLRAVLAEVPFVDVLRVMADPSLPLTTGEYLEWGDPADPEYRAAIAAYSPYDNVAATAYPSMLLTGAVNDDQVPYWQPAKWIAKLRATRTNDAPLFLRTHLGAGHGGSSGRYDRLREDAHDFAFVLDAVGLADREDDRRRVDRR